MHGLFKVKLSVSGSGRVGRNATRGRRMRIWNGLRLKSANGGSGLPALVRHDVAILIRDNQFGTHIAAPGRINAPMQKPQRRDRSDQDQNGSASISSRERLLSRDRRLTIICRHYPWQRSRKAYFYRQCRERHWRRSASP